MKQWLDYRGSARYKDATVAGKMARKRSQISTGAHWNTVKVAIRKRSRPISKRFSVLCDDEKMKAVKAGSPDSEGNFDRFTDFMRRLVAVPHSEIRAKLDAEKAAKKRKARPSASRDSGAKR